MTFSFASISALAFALDYLTAASADSATSANGSAFGFEIDCLTADFAVSTASAYASGSAVAGGGNFASDGSVSAAFLTAVLTEDSADGSGITSVSFED